MRYSDKFVLLAFLFLSAKGKLSFCWNKTLEFKNIFSKWLWKKTFQSMKKVDVPTKFSKFKLL